MIKAYADNSALSELRITRKFDEARSKYILAVMNKNGITSENVIITDKLFLELIGLGHLRKSVVNITEIDSLIAQHKEKLIQAKLTQETIEYYISFLFDLFDSEFKKNLPQDKIISQTMDYLIKNPFIEEFKNFESSLTQFSQKLGTDKERYAQFISVLVLDSVIRYALNFTNEIDKDDFLLILVILQRKYPVAFYENLLLTMSSLKPGVESSLKIKGEPRLMRLKDDFADSEPQQLVFYGKIIQGKHCPITFLTREPIKTIKKRFDYCFSAVIEVSNEHLRIGCSNPLLLWGKALVINIDELQTQEIQLNEYFNLLPKGSCNLYKETSAK